jgi:hypothetical protein
MRALASLQRLARCREMRQAEAEHAEEAQTEPNRLQGEASGLLLPLAAWSALAAYNPKLAVGAGGLTLTATAVFKKDWKWWAVGILLLVSKGRIGRNQFGRNQTTLKNSMFFALIS